MIRVMLKHIDIEEIEKNYDRYLGMLHKERRAAVERLRIRKTACYAIGAGMLLNEAFKCFYDMDFCSLTVDKEENGKPYLRDYPAIFFNLSHSGEYAVAACSNSNIGIDIERIDRKNGSIAKRCFCESEVRYVEGMYKKTALEGVDSDMGRFCHIWTIKEAFLKFTGEGISVPLDSICIDPYEGTVNGRAYNIVSKVQDGFIITVLSSEAQKVEFYKSGEEEDFCMGVINA